MRVDQTFQTQEYSCFRRLESPLGVWVSGFPARQPMSIPQKSSKRSQRRLRFSWEEMPS
jgi:hypothetical protein